MAKRNDKIGIRVPDILLPQKGIDLKRWAVVACDQYTSQIDYWRQVEEFVGNKESTLHLIFPEVYLEQSDKEDRINSINKTMKKYLDEGVLVPQKPGFIYVDRKTSHAVSRKGLMVEIDLEKYDFNKGSQTLVRATEGTDVQRLPPRVRIRENAYIELPHIMVLIDDPDKSIIEPLAEMTDKLELVYDFDLMMEGGHIKGYKVEDEALLQKMEKAFEKLADPKVFASKYKVNHENGVLMFAVGDGNHSLASAKAHWVNVKKTLLEEEEIENHPARFALVEIVNVHDEGLTFEPIHRVVFNIDLKKFLSKMQKFYTGKTTVSYDLFDSMEYIEGRLGTFKRSEDSHVIPFVTKDKYGVIMVENPKSNLEVGTLQAFLDDIVKTDSEVKVDYIHGKDVVNELGTKECNIGFFLPAMDKCDLFKTVILDGALPKKTFSMGEAEEKRFYLECRKIRLD